MPNWCSNRLTVNGPDKSMKQFVANIGDGPFTFDKFLPVPEELDGIHTGCITIDGNRHTYWRGIDKEDYKPLYDDEVTYLLDKYGAACPLEWRRNNWGCKWDVEIPKKDMFIDDNTLDVVFDTPWTPPLGFLQSISRRFDDLVFTLCCAEQGCGFYGSITIKSGDIENNIITDSFYNNNDELKPEIVEFLSDNGLHAGG